MLKKEELPDCPVATTVQLIGNKWKLLILRNLRMRPWRFNELGSLSARFMQKFRREWSIPSANWGKPCVRSWMRWNSGAITTSRRFIEKMPGVISPAF